MQAKLVINVCVFIIPTVAFAQSPYAKYFPREILPYEKAVCRIIVKDRDGTNSKGSGVLLETNHVLTAHHVITDRARTAGAIRVTWDGEHFYSYEVAAARPGCDAALLKPLGSSPGSVPKVPIAKQEIRQGELAYGFGFGYNNRLRCSGGRVVELTQNNYRDNVWFDYAGRFREGDSGGPVFVVRDKQPYVVGIAWGTSFDRSKGHHTVAATRLRVIHRMYGKEKARTNRGVSGRYVNVISGS